MTIVTGCFYKYGLKGCEKPAYSMHANEWPYHSTTYLGYSLESMKRQYRKDHKLKGKHIKWIITGLQEG